jgi:hypothetical protein
MRSLRRAGPRLWRWRAASTSGFAASDLLLRFPGLAGPQQDRALDLRRLHFPYTGRGAEPIFVAKALNGS